MLHLTFLTKYIEKYNNLTNDNILVKGYVVLINFCILFNSCRHLLTFYKTLFDFEWRISYENGKAENNGVKGVDRR